MKKKKFLSMVLVLVMLFSLTSGLQTVGAASSESDFTFDPDTGTITGYTGEGGALEIPSTIGDVAVTVIGSNVFNQNYSITSVSIPSGVISIDDYAFASCVSMISVVLPNTLESIGDYSFIYCNGLRSVVLPDTLQSIGRCALMGCKSLRGIVIPASVTSIDDYAFAGLDHLPIEKTDMMQAVFLGVAPTMGTGVFNWTADGFKIYYRIDKTGYSSPLWNGYSAESYDPAATYTLTYDANGGTGIIPAAVDISQVDHIIIPDDAGSLVKEGYKFNGWNTKADGTGVKYLKGYAFMFGVEDVTLYAQWKLVYSISIDTLEHGTITSDKTSAAKGEIFTLTITPDEGWKFKKGTLSFKDPTTGNIIKVSPSKLYSSYTMPASDILVTAEFAEGDFLFETTTGGAITITEYIGSGGSVVIPSTIEGKTVNAIGDMAFLFNLNSTDVRIPASVTTIGFGAFGDCSIEHILFEGDAPALGELCFPSRIHYPNFKIYYIEGSTGFTSPAWSEYSPIAVSASDVVAADKAALDIGYAAGDSITAVTQNLSLSVTGAVYGSNITWSSNNSAVISNSGVVTRPAFSSGDTNVTVTASVHNNGASDTKDFDLKVLKLATVTTYTVTFKNWDGAALKTEIVNEGSGATAPANPTRAGYTFTGWDKTYNNITSNLIVTAQYAKNNPSNDDKDDNGGGGSSTPTNSNPAAPAMSETPKIDTTVSGNISTATTTTKVTVDNTGKATAAVTLTQVTDAVSKAVEAAAKQGNGTEAMVEIKVEAPAITNIVEASLPKAAVDTVAGSNIIALTLSTPIAAITFDSQALDTIAGAAATDVKISIAKVDAKTLDEDTKQLVGDRAVYNFSVTSGDKTISQFHGNISVSIPYIPKPGEDTNAIVIYYINAEGKPEIVRNCAYDPATGCIIFTTNHFFRYAVGYNKVNFKDVPAAAWYGKAVSFIAAREIATGIGNGNFGPEAKLTRGEFLVMLMRAYDIAPDINQKDNFADAGDAYYTVYLAAAKQLGISRSVGNNMFAPDKEITRQEMFTLLYNALKTRSRLPQGNSGKQLSSYSDSGQVASWAKDAMMLFAETGIISGNGGKLSAASTTTRAEMAQVLYNLLLK